MSRKIGMCCACDDQLSKSKTIMSGGLEYCPKCAEMLGIDEEEEE